LGRVAIRPAFVFQRLVRAVVQLSRWAGGGSTGPGGVLSGPPILGLRLGLSFPRAGDINGMGQRWMAPDGWEVEAIRVNNRQILRVRHGKTVIVYARSVEDLVRVLTLHGVNPADLEEAED
jgi:hypothetical protein